MEVEKNKPLFDTSIPYDSSHLPKFLQEEIEELSMGGIVINLYDFEMLKFKYYEILLPIYNTLRESK